VGLFSRDRGPSRFRVRSNVSDACRRSDFVGEGRFRIIFDLHIHMLHPTSEYSQRKGDIIYRDRDRDRDVQTIYEENHVGLCMLEFMLFISHAISKQCLQAKRLIRFESALMPSRSRSRSWSRDIYFGNAS